MTTLEPLMTLDAELDFQMIGKTPAGLRLDVPFQGAGTSPHWDGGRPVQGTDYVTVGASGIGSLRIRGQIGEGRDIISYEAMGTSGPDSITEVFAFQTAAEGFEHLNGICAVGTGTVDGTKLHLEIFTVVP